jgi:hypothetical protein
MMPGQGMGMGAGMIPGQHGMTGVDPGLLSVEQIWGLVNHGIFVKQKFDLLEALTGCEQANTYMVHELNPSGEQKKKAIFKCKEKSGCCARNCLAADCRPFDMEVKRVTNNEFAQEMDLMAIKMERECQCTCYCFNRPEMKVYTYKQMGGAESKTYIGKVVDNYDFCNFSYNVCDVEGKIIFFIKASCCQCGFCCKCPCEPCEKITFDFWRGDKEVALEPIMKVGTGNCLKNAISDADNFRVPFPPGATPNEKSLLLAAVLMIDFMQFEEKGGANKSGLPAGGDGFD